MRRSGPVLSLLAAYAALSVAISLHRQLLTAAPSRIALVGVALLLIAAALVGQHVRLPAWRRWSRTGSLAERGPAAGFGPGWPAISRSLGRWDLVLLGLVLTLWVELGSQLALVIDIGNRSPSMRELAIGLFGVTGVVGALYLPWVLPRAGEWPSARGVRLRRLFVVVMVLAAALKIAAIFAFPTPTIDVWRMMQAGARLLSAGEDPYATFMPEVLAAGRGHGYPVSSYVYAPSMLLVTWPFYLVFGDYRYAYVVADLAACGLLLLIARGAGDRARVDRYAELLALLLLMHPVAFGKAYSDELLVPFLLLAVWLGQTRPGSWMHAAAAGFLVSLKLYLVFLLPLMVLQVVVPARRRALAVTVFALAASASALPFLLWDLAAFVDQAVLFHLRTPALPHGMGFAAWLSSCCALSWPAWTGPVAAGLLSLLGAQLTRGRADGAWLVWGVGGCLVGFFFGANLFPNYLHFVMAMIVAAGLELLSKPDHAVAAGARPVSS
ncbi:MAG: hypothetical protein HY903_06885 [Deltaproteobacteria bacterium]|nr:hypothetical protein [Deltaproteobacteria bacterium]